MAGNGMVVEFAMADPKVRAHSGWAVWTVDVRNEDEGRAEMFPAAGTSGRYVARLVDASGAVIAELSAQEARVGVQLTL